MPCTECLLIDLLFKISEDDLDILTGIKDPDKVGRPLLNDGLRLMVITCVFAGSMIFTPTLKSEIKSFPVNAIDLSGALSLSCSIASA